MFISRVAAISSGRGCSVNTILHIAARASMAPSMISSKRTYGATLDHGSNSKAKRTKRERNIRAGGSSEDILRADIKSLLRQANFHSKDRLPPPQLWTEIEVKIESLSSTGDGLGRAVLYPTHVFVVPFTAPGDVVMGKVIAHVQEPIPYVKAEFVKIIESSPWRNDSLVRCRYFGECSGCQFQMLPYSYQLEHKKTVVERAYRNFSCLPQDLIPPVGETIGSPLQYSYRTKLTPHFDGPKNGRKLARKGQRAHFEEVPPIGFHKKQMHRTMDIEECPISTDAVQLGLRRERERVKVELAKYSKGATLLLRESTDRIERSEVPPDVNIPGYDATSQTYYEYNGVHIHAKTCITNPRSIFTEYVDGFRIRNSANSFFQNNASILTTFISYIRSQSSPALSAPTTHGIKNLIDAYSGCGLFSITLSSLFNRTIGIDIDNSAIAQARENVKNNIRSTSTASVTRNDKSLQGLLSPIHELESPRTTSKSEDSGVRVDGLAGTLDKDQLDNSNVGGETGSGLSEPHFIAADASQLFASVKTLDPAETVVILDPPRKGCDESFLKQLLDFGPERIIYVSCNVHTQAADVGWFLRGGQDFSVGEENELASENMKDKPTGTRQGHDVPQPAKYLFESLRGFDFFPQTGHVESVAVLKRQRL